MDRAAFLNAIIDDGIEDVRISHPRPDQTVKREAGIKAFSDCRGLDDDALTTLHERAVKARETAMRSNASDYWWHRMYELQIEWVLNVISAAAFNQGLPPLIPPTARGMAKAADILGVKQ